MGGMRWCLPIQPRLWPYNGVTVEDVAMIEKVLGLPIGF